MSKFNEDDFDEGQLYGNVQQAVPQASPVVVAAMSPVAPMPVAAPVQNPLMKYYRQPGLHVRLPTGGAFMPQGSIKFTQAGDLPVLPMKAQDELLLKNPDALMSGLAIEKLLESCVPGMTAPKWISTPDLDVLLLAIRAATFGNEMLLTAKCPKCGHEGNFGCDLGQILATMQDIPAENPIRLSDEVIAYIRPYHLHNATSLALCTFEEARKLQALDVQDASPQERTKSTNDSIEKLTKMNLRLLSDCVMRIVVPEGVVVDRGQIAEFITNVPKPWVTKIQNGLSALNDMGIDKNIHPKCQKCDHEWKTEIEFNPASFFADGSSQS